VRGVKVPRLQQRERVFLKAEQVNTRALSCGADVVQRLFADLP